MSFSAGISGPAVEGGTLTAEIFVDVPVTEGGGSGGGGGGGGTGGGTGGGGGAPLHPAPTLIYSPPWRFLVTTRDGFGDTKPDPQGVTTFLDKRAMRRTLTFELNMPAQAQGTVSSDDPEVYITLGDPDDDPYLAEGNRLLYCFRREGSYVGDVYTPWVCRFAGIILQINDLTETDQPLSTFTAFDPWQYLMSRPVVDADGNLPGRAGLTSAKDFPSKKGSELALELLRRTIHYHGAVGIDAGVAYEGTSHFGEGGGFLVATQELDITFQQGMMVGEAWQSITDTDTIDINLAPIYDPFNRPGYMSELQVCPKLGDPANHTAIMAWDMPSRSLLNLDRLEDGTQRANIAQFSTQGGNLVPPAIDGAPPLDTPAHTPSQNKFGEYWATQLSIGQASLGPDINAPGPIIQELEIAQVAIRSCRATTIQIDPDPARAPIPLLEYKLGDTVPIYASQRLRKPINGSGRIYQIPITLDDDGVERIEQLVFSADSLDVGC